MIIHPLRAAVGKWYKNVLVHIYFLMLLCCNSITWEIISWGKKKSPYSPYGPTAIFRNSQLMVRNSHSEEDKFLLCIHWFAAVVCCNYWNYLPVLTSAPTICVVCVLKIYVVRLFKWMADFKLIWNGYKMVCIHCTWNGTMLQLKCSIWIWIKSYRLTKGC